jgi:hypothetical protein
MLHTVDLWHGNATLLAHVNNQHPPHTLAPHLAQSSSHSMSSTNVSAHAITNYQDNCFFYPWNEDRGQSRICDCKSSPSSKPHVVQCEREQEILEVLNLLAHPPVWVFDIETKSMTWVNEAPCGSMKSERKA